MDSSGLGIIIVGSMFVLGFTVIFIRVLMSGDRVKGKIQQVKKEIYCPNCKTDITKDFERYLKTSIQSELKHRCKNCSSISLWNISGFPPTLLDYKVKEVPQPPKAASS